MNTIESSKRKVNYVLLRDYKGNICYTKVGDKMPPLSVDNIDTPIITGMKFFEAHHNNNEQYYIIIELINGNRELWNIDQIEDYQLAAE